MCIFSLCLQEHVLDQTLSHLPPLTTSDLSSLTDFVESVYRSQSVAALDQLTLRRRIVEELQALAHVTLPGESQRRWSDTIPRSGLPHQRASSLASSTAKLFADWPVTRGGPTQYLLIICLIHCKTTWMLTVIQIAN